MQLQPNKRLDKQSNDANTYSNFRVNVTQNIATEDNKCSFNGIYRIDM